MRASCVGCFVWISCLMLGFWFFCLKSHALNICGGEYSQPPLLMRKLCADKSSAFMPRDAGLPLPLEEMDNPTQLPCRLSIC